MRPATAHLGPNNMFLVCCIALVLPAISLSVTTTHYDKAAETKPPPSSVVNEKPHTRIVNLTLAERQKRLLPYINFYLQNYNPAPNEAPYQQEQKYRLIPASKLNYQPQQTTKFSELIGSYYQPDKAYEPQQILYPNKAKFTPFLESNALPGPFLPMVNPQPQKIKVAYAPQQQNDKVPNYSAIYDKLSQLKLQQTALHHDIQHNAPQYVFSRKPAQINFVPLRQYHEQSDYPSAQAPKNFVHNYEYHPTTIEVPANTNDDVRYESQDYETDVGAENPKSQPHDEAAVSQEPIRLTQVIQEPIRVTQINNPKQHIYGKIVIEAPPGLTPQQTYMPIIPKDHPQTHYIVHEQKPYHTQNHQQYLQEVVPGPKQPILVPQKAYAQIQYAENPPKQMKVAKPPIIFLQPAPTHIKPYTPEPIPIATQPYEPLATVQQLPQIVAPAPEEIQTENPNSLAHILRRLQESNALPQTLTPDNIDNSIKTLVHILSALKKQQQLTTRPIVVAEEDADYEEQDNEAGVGLGDSQPPPGTIVQAFPAHTPEGGTPGKPGVDYPALSTIPHTDFNCKTQRYKGFFADPDTHCQVWHYCDLNGGQASFLCPNGTIFSQVALTCDWWFNVKCSTTTQLYVLNERLYKYIIPLTPKFPEDYTGPLVDKYLALKFKEMEEKMKNEKKDKSKDDKVEEVDELQLLEDKNAEQRPEAAPPEDHK